MPVGSIVLREMLLELLKDFVYQCKIKRDIVAMDGETFGRWNTVSKSEREIVTNAVHNQITKQRVVLWPGQRCMCRDTALETHAMYENASLIKERMSRLHATG